eukprot:3346054-Amphidinium_carterae.1
MPLLCSAASSQRDSVNLLLGDGESARAGGTSCSLLPHSVFQGSLSLTHIITPPIRPAAHTHRQLGGAPPLFHHPARCVLGLLGGGAVPQANFLQANAVLSLYTVSYTHLRAHETEADL